MRTRKRTGRRESWSPLRTSFDDLWPKLKRGREGKTGWGERESSVRKRREAVSPTSSQYLQLCCGTLYVEWFPWVGGGKRCSFPGLDLKVIPLLSTTLRHCTRISNIIQRRYSIEFCDLSDPIKLCLGTRMSGKRLLSNPHHASGQIPTERGRARAAAVCCAPCRPDTSPLAD